MVKKLAIPMIKVGAKEKYDKGKHIHTLYGWENVTDKKQNSNTGLHYDYSTPEELGKAIYDPRQNVIRLLSGNQETQWHYTGIVTNQRQLTPKELERLITSIENEQKDQTD